jgi:hypothetical protein
MVSRIKATAEIAVMVQYKPVLRLASVMMRQNYTFNVRVTNT